MRFALMVDPQEGLAYAAMLELARAAESAGFDGFVRSDHWLSLEGRWDRPASDAWTTLAGLARDTRRIRLGTMVSPVTFRHPVALAKIVTTMDEMSGGRVELGIGAGWYTPEHQRFGLPDPPRAERFELLEEQLQIVRGLWTSAHFSFSGRYYRLQDAVCEPKPLQRPHPPIVVGGYGRPRLVQLAATYADELNLDSPTPATCREVFARLDDACGASGRDPATVGRSAMLMWGAADAALPSAAQRDRIVAYRDAGVQRIVLNVWPGPGDPAMIDRFGYEVIAELA